MLKEIEGYRIERDVVGQLHIPEKAYYGIQALRAQENFKITGQKTDTELIKAVAEIKKACAMTNFEVGILEENKKNAIIKACDEIIAGNLHDSFIVDPIQGGAGTSHNMNANEVIANRAIEILGGVVGEYKKVHPIDDVNEGQSTNDVFPTCGKIASIRLIMDLKKSLKKLQKALEEKAKEFDDVIKMGRTQLQDAIPIRLGQEFNAYAKAVSRDVKRMDQAIEVLEYINMGATATGTGLNADVNYLSKIVPNLSKVTGLKLKQVDDLIDGTQNLDCFAYASAMLRTCAINLSKMSNDLRLMSSGPLCGLAEINLPARQNGSSIMPGKVNPVIAEVVSQVAFNVIGNDVTITMATEGGQLELNAFEPVIFYTLFESARTLKGAVETLTENCVKGITANRERTKKMVDNSIGIITALVPHIGYNLASDIAKESLQTGVPVKELVLKSGAVTQEEIDKILDVFSMTNPGISAIELIKKKQGK